MPYRIIRPCIVGGVKPHQLIAGLMQKAGLGPSPLAKKMGKPKLQPQIHRFVNGQVANPERKTALPLAEYFGLPLEAIYDEKLATKIAAERGIQVPPAAPEKPPPTRRRKDAAAPVAEATNLLLIAKVREAVREAVRAEVRALREEMASKQEPAAPPLPKRQKPRMSIDEAIERQDAKDAARETAERALGHARRATDRKKE